MKAFLVNCSIPLLLLVTAPACSLTSSPQQKHLSALTRNDVEIGRFKLATGRDGDTVFVDLKEAAADARPMEAIRAFMSVAHEYRGESFASFELRHRGTPRISYSRADIVELSGLFQGNDRMLFVLQEMLNRAHLAGRSPATAVVEARPYDASKPPAESLVAMRGDLQTFLGTWYMKELGQAGL